MNQAEWLRPAARLALLTGLACLLLAWPAWWLAPARVKGWATSFWPISAKPMRSFMFYVVLKMKILRMLTDQLTLYAILKRLIWS